MPTLPADTMEVVVRLFVAALVGGCIGLDREVRQKPAGMRTHALVSLGAALIVLVVVRFSPATTNHIDAVSRAIQGIIAGVGFLGGGAILKADRGTVHGLTTAASIWVVASLGIASGAGQWVAALIALAFALIILIFGEPVERFVRRIAKRKVFPPDDDITTHLGQ